MGSSPFFLRTFGGLAVEGGDGVPLSDLSVQRKALALLALLAGAGADGLAREKILAYLWAESDADRARNALYNLLFRVRRLLGADAIVGSVRLSLDPSRVASDVAEFERAIKSGSFEIAADLYRGPFLDAFYVREAPEFERWVSDERARLSRDYLQALDSLALSASRSRDPQSLLKWTRRHAEADPLSSRAAMRYVDALVATGDRETALSFGAVHAARIREELEAEPDPELIARLNRLRVAPSTLPVDRSTLDLRVDPEVQRPVAVETAAGRSLSDSTPLLKPRKRLVVVGLTVLCVTLIAASAAYRASSMRVDSRRVFVAAFDNRTGDSTLDVLGRIAAEGITQRLARVGLIAVVDPATALATSKHVRDRVAQLENANAVSMLARDTHAGLVITGSYFVDHGDLVAQAHITDVSRNEIIAATDAIRAPLANRIALVDAVRDHVVGALALRVDKRLATIMPAGNSPSYEAYEAFIAGLEVFTTGLVPPSAPYFERAYALDSSFVEPLIWEAFAVGGQKRDSIVQRLERRRASLSQIDRYALDYHRASLDGAIEIKLIAARNAARLAPGSHWTHNVAVALTQLGRSREAAAVFETVPENWVRTWPGFWIGYLHALHLAGMHEKELEVARAARRVLPANQNLRMDEAVALAMTQHWDEFEQRLRDIERDPNFRWMPPIIASELHLHGDSARSAEINGRALRWMEARERNGGTDLGSRRALSRQLYAAGHWSEAQSLTDSLYAGNPSDQDLKEASFLLAARLGNRHRAEAGVDSLLAEAHGLTARDRLVDAARIAAVLGERERAIELLERAQGAPGYQLRHRNPFASDWDSLQGNPRFERVIHGQ